MNHLTPHPDPLPLQGRGRRQGDRFQRSDGDVVEIAKAHRSFARGVMAGRAHEAENIFACARKLQRIQRRSHGRAGVLADALEERRVGVEIFRHFQSREQGGRVGAEDLFVAHGRWRPPVQRQFGLVFQQLDGGGDAVRAFGMTGFGILGAVFVGDENNSGKIIPARETKTPANYAAR